MRRPALLLVLLLLGWLLYLLLSRDGSRARTRGGAEQPEGPARPTQPAEDSAGIEQGDLPSAGSLPPSGTRETITRGDTPGGHADAPTRRVKGVVLRLDRSPVAGAHVLLLSSWRPRLLDPEATGVGTILCGSETAEDGTFELISALGPSLLRVSHDKYLRAVLDPVPETGRVEIVIGDPVARLRGRVTRQSDGTPVANATLTVSVGRRGCYGVGWHTDENGVYELENVPAGSAEMSVVAHGLGGVVGRRIEIPPTGVKTVDFELGEGYGLRGEVVDAKTGAGVSNAHVRLRVYLVQTPFRVDANEKGRFVFPRMTMAAGERKLIRASADGYAPTDVMIGGESGGEETITIRMHRGGSALARCVDAEGKPVPDAVAELISRSLDERLSMVMHEHAVEAHADLEGRLGFDGVRPGKHGLELTVYVRGLQVAHREYPALREGESRDLGDVVVPVTQVLEGSVRTHLGEPAFCATVVVVPHDDDDPEHHGIANAILVPAHHALVDSDGRFRIRGLARGRYDLLVHGVNFPRLLRLDLAVPGSGTLDLVLPEAIALRGQVLDADGQPVAGARVDYARAHPVSANLVESARTSTEGRFLIPGFTAEDEDVEIWVSPPEVAHRDQVRHLKVTPRNGPIEVRLEK